MQRKAKAFLHPFFDALEISSMKTYHLTFRLLKILARAVQQGLPLNAPIDLRYLVIHLANFLSNHPLVYATADIIITTTINHYC